MDLQDLFFISLSIEAIVVTVLIIVFIYFVGRLSREIALINKKVMKAAEEGVEAAEEAKKYIGKIGKSIVDYFVVKILRNIRTKK